MATTNTTIRISALDNASGAFRNIANSVNASTRAMQGAQRRLSAISSSMASVGAGLALSITAPVAAAARSLEGVNRELSEAANNLAAISGIDISTVGGAREFKVLSDAAKAAAEQIGLVSQAQALQAQGFMAMAGLSRDAIAGATLPVLQMAVGLNLDAATVADKLTNIASALNLDLSTSESAARNLARIGDLVATAATNANVSAAQVFESLKSAAPVAAAMGMDLESAMGLVMAMGDKGIQGGEAGTALKSTAARFLAPTKQARETFAAAGIDPTSYFTDIQAPDFTGLSKALAESGIVTTQQMLSQQAEIDTILRDTGRTVSERITSIRDHLSGSLGLTGEDGAALARSIGDYASGLGGSFDFPGLLADMDRMGISAAQQAQIIGKNHFARITGLISSIGKAQEYTRLLRDDASGAMAGQVKARTQGLDGATKAFNASLKNFGAALGGAGFTEMSINFKRRMTGIMDAVARMDRGVLASGMKFTAWAGALGPGLVALGAITRVAAFGLSPFVALTRALGTSALALSRLTTAAITAKGALTALSMPRILPVAGFAAAAVGIGWAVKSILGSVSALPEVAGPLRDVKLSWSRLMTGMRSGVDGAFRVGLDGLAESLRDLSAALGGALRQSAGNWFGDTFGADALTNLKKLGISTTDLGTGLRAAFAGAVELDLSAVTSGLSGAGAALASFAASFVSVAATVGRGLLKRILPESALAALDEASGYVVKLGEALRNGFSASVDLSGLSGLSDMLTNVKTALTGAASSLVAFLGPLARKAALNAFDAVHVAVKALPGMFARVGSIAGAAFGAITSAVASVASGFAAAFNLDAIAAAFGGLRSAAGDAITSIGNALGALPVVGSLFGDGETGKAAALATALEAIKAAADGLSGPLNVVGSILGTIASSAAAMALKGLSLALDGVALGIRVVTAAVKLAITGVKTLIDWLGKIEMPDNISVFGFDFKLPDMPEIRMPDITKIAESIGSFLGLRAAINLTVAAVKRLGATRVGAFFVRLATAPLAAKGAMRGLAMAASAAMAVFARFFLSPRALGIMALSEAIIALQKNWTQVSTDTSAAIGKIKKALKSLDLKEFLSGSKDFGKALLPALKDLAKSPMLITALGAAAAWKAAGVVAGAAWRLAWSGAARLTSAITGMISALAGAAWRVTASAAGATFSAAWRAAASVGSAITSMITALAGAAWRATGLVAGAAFSAGYRVASVVGSAVTRMITALASAAWAVTGTAAGAAFSAAARTAMVLGSAITGMITALGAAGWRAAGLVAGATFSAGFKVASKLGAVAGGIVTGLGSGLDTKIGAKAAGWGKTAMRVVGRGLLRAIPFIGLGILAYDIGRLIYDNFSDEIWAAVDKLKVWFKTKLEALFTIATELKASAKAKFKELGETIAAAIREPFADVLNWFSEKLDGLTGLAKKVAQALGFVAADGEPPRANPHPDIYQAPKQVAQVQKDITNLPAVRLMLAEGKPTAGLFSGLEQTAQASGASEDQGPSLWTRWFGGGEPANDGSAPALALPAMPQIDVPQPIVNNVATAGAEVINLPQIERIEVSTPTPPAMPMMAAPERLDTSYLEAATRAFFALPQPSNQTAAQGDPAPAASQPRPVIGKVATREMPQSFAQQGVSDANGARIESAINTLVAAIQSGAITSTLKGKADVSVRVRADGSLQTTGSAVAKGDVSVGLDVGTDPTAP